MSTGKITWSKCCLPSPKMWASHVRASFSKRQDLKVLCRIPRVRALQAFRYDKFSGAGSFFLQDAKNSHFVQNKVKDILT